MYIGNIKKQDLKGNNMSEGNGIRVRIQRGAAQIGGVCTEVFTDQTRIFFMVITWVRY